MVKLIQRSLRTGRDVAEAMALRVLARRAPAARRAHFRDSGLRAIRECWWIHTRYESPLTFWRAIWQLEQTSEPRAGLAPSAPNPYIVVYSPGHIGDLLHTVPLLRALRARYPASRLDWVVGPWVRDLALRYAVADHVLTFSPAWHLYRRGAPGPGAGEQVHWAKALAADPADIFISTSITDLSTLFVGRAFQPLQWLGRVPALNIYPVAGQQSIVTPDPDRYEAEDLLHLAAPLGVSRDDSALAYQTTQEERSSAQQLLARRGIDARTPYVVLAPSAGWSGKQWPLDRWSHVVRTVSDRGYLPLLVGGAQDIALVAEVLRGRESTGISLAGQTTLLQLAALIEAAKLWIGSDSGGLHLAAAVGTPTLSLFGPTPPKKWAPRGDQHKALRAVTGCPHCIPWHPRASCAEGGRCMQLISVDEVCQSLCSMLEERNRD